MAGATDDGTEQPSDERFVAEVMAEDARPNVPALDALAYNDMGNGRLLVARHGIDLRYVRDSDTWLVWNQRFWEANRIGAEALAKETIDAQYPRLASIVDKSEARELYRHLRTFGSAQHVAGSLTMARSENGVRAVSNALDANELAAQLWQRHTRPVRS